MLKKRTLAISLALFLLAVALTPQALAAGAGNFVNLADAPANPLYTPLEIPGYSHTLYAFTGLDGKTQFRVYGQQGAQSGYFPATLTAGAGYQPGGLLQVTLAAGATPVQDNESVAATATLSAAAAPIPLGFHSAGVPGILYMENIFGQKEYLAYASYDGQNYLYIPALNNLPIPGALAAVVEDMPSRAKLSHEAAVPLPANLQGGFKTLARLVTGDGTDVMVSTAYPPIERAGLAQPTMPPSTPQPTVRAVVASTPRTYTSVRRTPRPATPKPDGTATPKPLQYGATGTEVTNLQKRLDALGYMVGKADGRFGSLTKNALIAFQKNNGLKGDGILGPATLKKLNAAEALPAIPSSKAIRNPLTLSASAGQTEAFVGDTITWTANAKGWGGGSYRFVDMLVMHNGVAYQSSKVTKGESGSVSIKADKPGTYSLSVTAGSSEYVVNKKSYYDNGSVSGTAAVVVKVKAEAVVTTETVKETKAIEFTTETRDNPELEEGLLKIIQEGANGEKVVTYTVTKTDGVETARKQESEEITKPMVPKIVEKGTKKPVITTETITVVEVIPFTRETRDNAELEQGTENIVQAGIDGANTVTYTITKKDGVETSRVKVSETVTRAMVPELKEIGTKPKPVVTTETATETESIPFETEKVENPDLEKGTERVKREGVNGVKTITYEITKTNGVETARVKKSEVVTTEPVNKIIEVGTKEPETTTDP